METTQPLAVAAQPAQAVQLAKTLQLERKIAKKIMAMNPGVGDKSIAIAESLVECGLAPAMTASLLEVVFAPPTETGAGKANRWKWFNMAVQRRYHGRIDKIRNNLSAFRLFLSEMEELNEMRDTLAGESFSFSYEESFMLQEVGLNASYVLSLLNDLLENNSRLKAQKIVKAAARCVLAGHFASIETAIKEMTYGDESDYRILGN